MMRTHYRLWSISYSAIARWYLGVLRSYEGIKNLLKEIHRVTVKDSIVLASTGRLSGAHRYRFRLSTLVSE
ncbi:MAG: hypothetical protein DRO18_00620 [Thermoprotei archaeon]|nr:MAG: hypothetical protein DRO18_00620 [Thermoprotei archaeon]